LHRADLPEEYTMTVMRRAIAAITAVCLLGTSLPAVSQPSQAANTPALVTTEEALADSVPQRVAALLARSEVRAALAARGVTPSEVEARVAALSDSEAQQLAAELDRLPAGGSEILGILFAVFIILLITDILGLTKVFPFTRPVK
jgi:hypothetical protein